MAVSSAFDLYAVMVDEVLIDQITDFSASDEASEILLNAGGEVFDRFVAAGTQVEALNFSSNAIASALGVAGLSGKEIKAGDIIDCYFQKYKAGGTREGALAHPKLTVNKGILVPTGISVENDQPAVINLFAQAVYDGTNQPIKYTADQSLAGSPNANEGFTVGPVKPNGSVITGIQGTNIEFGIQLIPLGGDGEGHITFVAIKVTKCVVTFRTLDVATALANVKLEGTAQGETDSVVYLRKLAAGGLRVPNATEQHISFTMDAGRMQVLDISGSPAIATCRFTAIFDGTNDPLVISVAAAIV